MLTSIRMQTRDIEDATRDVFGPARDHGYKYVLVRTYEVSAIPYTAECADAYGYRLVSVVTSHLSEHTAEGYNCIFVTRV